MGERTGLTIVYTGDGKGKTTAAIGLAIRALGSALRTTILQFVKTQETGEHRALADLAAGRIEILRLGSGFVRGDGPPPAEAVAAARKALHLARRRLTGGTYDIVVLDEVFAALAAQLISERELLNLIDLRPSGVHLVLTGRGAPQSVIDRADVVTEMVCVKYAFDRGASAQPGIEI